MYSRDVRDALPIDQSTNFIQKSCYKSLDILQRLNILKFSKDRDKCQFDWNVIFITIYFKRNRYFLLKGKQLSNIYKLNLNGLHELNNIFLTTHFTTKSISPVLWRTIMCMAFCDSLQLHIGRNTYEWIC